MKNKRGQAAMEFLMTYGWAILAAVIVVGVLWYMIGNPADLAGSQFQIGAPIANPAMVLSGDIQLEFRNGLAEQMTITNVTIGSDCAGNNGTGATVPAGAFAQFNIDCPTDLVADTRFNGPVTIYYSAGSGSLVQQATGTIQGKVA